MLHCWQELSLTQDSRRFLHLRQDSSRLHHFNQNSGGFCQDSRRLHQNSGRLHWVHQDSGRLTGGFWLLHQDGQWLGSPKGGRQRFSQAGGRWVGTETLVMGCRWLGHASRSCALLLQWCIQALVCRQTSCLTLCCAQHGCLFTSCSRLGRAAIVTRAYWFVCPAIVAKHLWC